MFTINMMMSGRRAQNITKASWVLVFLVGALAGESQATNRDKHYVPYNKKLDANWVQSLFERGNRKVYRGEELTYTAMPCGGIGSGQLEITGDGTLATWWIFNEIQTNGWNGLHYLHPVRPEKPVENGFAIRIHSEDSEAMVLRLDNEDFDDLGFIGEYPIATLQYRRTQSSLPVTIESEVFSPFVPLCVRDSANPVTIFRFHITNVSDKAVDVAIGGWLENATMIGAGDNFRGQRRNTVVQGDGFNSVYMDFVDFDVKRSDNEACRTVMIEDFETPVLRKDAPWVKKVSPEQWTIDGKAFETMADAENQLKTDGYQGQNFIYSGMGNNQATGRLTSRPFEIRENYIVFMIAGGRHPKDDPTGPTCINLIVDGRVVKSSTGDNSPLLRVGSWDVSEFKGKTAQLQLIDENTSETGYLVIDNIYQVNIEPPRDGRISVIDDGRMGSMALAVLDTDTAASAQWNSMEEFLPGLRTGKRLSTSEKLYPITQKKPCGTLVSNFKLEAGEQKTVNFMITWFFPNLRLTAPGVDRMVGRMYANSYSSALDVVKYVSENFDRLYANTRLFRDVYFDSTLPYWLLHRIGMPVSTLACDNITLWQNGRMYGYEGVGFCFGTCGHVFNFVTAIAYLFPELERSVRLQQDLGPGFATQTGCINFRGFDRTDLPPAWSYATDAQSGYVLKFYREHRMSPDRSFLDSVWPKVKKIIGFQIFHDGADRGLEPDGVLEAKQTFWDPHWLGPNPYNNTLYIAALRAAEEMARIEGEITLAQRYHRLYESGRKFMIERMWNGEYFVHLYPEGRWERGGGALTTTQEEQKNAKNYIEEFTKGETHYFMSTACDSQQLFGQNLAHQLGLGYILPASYCRSAAQSIFLYNWTPDIDTVYRLYPPKNRTVAAAGEGAMVNASWPRPHIERKVFENIHDKDDVWVGLEYESACDMINEGLLQESLTMIRSIHDRYNGVKRNPWNEIEGWDHYSRAMQSWNVLLALSGYIYDGPAGRIGFTPRMTQEEFKCFFTAAKGWGSFLQKRQVGGQINCIEVKWGELRVKTLVLGLPVGKTPVIVNVWIDDKLVDATIAFELGRAIINLSKTVDIIAGSMLKVEIGY